MKILALGGCCKKSAQNYENAIIAARNSGITESVENIKDINQIMGYGVMSTPALVIDGKVVAMGRMLSVQQIEELIRNRK